MSLRMPGDGRKPRRPVVVRCSHGIEGGEAEFVARYRYDVTAGRWNATDFSAEGRTWVTDAGHSSPNMPPMFDEDGEPHEESREHFNARCKRCRRLVPMRADRAQIALSRLSDLGLPAVPIALLQRAYDEVPPQ